MIHTPRRARSSAQGYDSMGPATTQRVPQTSLQHAETAHDGSMPGNHRGASGRGSKNGSVRAEHVEEAHLLDSHLNDSGDRTRRSDRGKLASVCRGGTASDPEEGRPRLDAGAAASASSSTFLQCVMNMANILMGVGILGLPFVLRAAGWLGGTITIVIFALTTNYTAKLVGRCLLDEPHPSEPPPSSSTVTTMHPFLAATVDSVRRATAPGDSGVLHTPHPRTTFPRIAMDAFGRPGAIGLATVLYFELFSCLGIFFVTLGAHMHALFPSIQASTHACIMAVVLVIPTALLRTPRLLSYLSAVGTAATVALVLSVAGCAVAFALEQRLRRGQTPNSSSHGLTYHPFAFEGLPTALGLVAYAFSGHAIIPTVHASMADPRRDFETMVDVSYLLVVFCCMLVAVAGYWMFGDQGTRDQITLSLADRLNPSPTSPPLASSPTPAQVFIQCLTALMILTAFSKFTLTLFPLALGVEEALFPHLAHRCLRSTKDVSIASLITRVAIISAALAVALGVPSFGFLCSLVGLLCALSVSVIFPAAAHLALFTPALSTVECAVDATLIVGGTIAVVAGTAATIRQPALV